MVSEHGRGVFVRPAAPIRRLASDPLRATTPSQRQSSIHRRGREIRLHAQVDNIITVTRQRPNSVVAERLRLTTDDDVVVRPRRYLADGRPVETAISYIPAAFAEGTKIEQTDTGPGGIYARLEDAGHTLARFTEEVGARMPTPRRTTRLATSGGGTRPDGEPGRPMTPTTWPSRFRHGAKAASAYLLEYDFSAR